MFTCLGLRLTLVYFKELEREGRGRIEGRGGGDKGIVGIEGREGETTLNYTLPRLTPPC